MEPRKIMVLTDSDGFPRSFPPPEVFELEETWPYLLRRQFKDATFWQLSFGNITTMDLVSQPMGYLTHWQPDVIVVQSGIADCRPEAFTQLQRDIIVKMTWKFFSRIRPYIDHPDLIRRRQKYRTTPGNFRVALKKFKLIFPKSKVFWLEIAVGDGFEKFRPGTLRRKEQYNALIKEIYGDNFVAVQERLSAVNGFNAIDFGHQNKRGHQAVAGILIERIKAL
jgi:hypothetical protein